MKLAGKTAFVTGAGSGIGRAIAILFGQEGANVVAADIRLGAAEETAALIAAKHGSAIAVAGDVAVRQDVDSMFDVAVLHFGRIDILCNNAGILDGSSFLQMEEDVWDRTIDTNLKGTFLCSKRAASEMVRTGGGAIVNTASITGLRGGGSDVAYTASKHGVIGLTRGLANELSPLGIRVNAFCPGAIRTPMNGMFGDARLLEDMCAVPLRRVGEPEEMAKAALFLACDDSSFSTGSILVVDGGKEAVF